MRDVLVTGANGFVGRALCKRLLADGYQVRGAVRGAAQITALLSGIEGVMVGNIGPDTDWSKALNGVDVVVHLAARVHMMNDTASDPLVAFRWMNVKGTERLAQQAAATGCRCFFFMSSVKVNGESTGVRGHPGEIRFAPHCHEFHWVKRGEGGELKEFFFEEDVLEPQDPYAVSKWEAEQVLHKISQETGLGVVILRPPLVYGPGVKANFLRLLKIVGRSIPLPLANVNNQRSLIYIENLVDAIVTCFSHPKAAGQTYLVSDCEDVSVPELIRAMANAMGKPPRLFPFPLFLMRLAGRILGKSASVERLLGSLTVDCSKIKRELGWKPPYTMAQGIEKTAKWYKKRGREVQVTDYPG